jgi:hypothetical protein
VKIRGILTMVAGALLAACGVIQNYPVFHYRLTVEVETPEGLRTGSSVIEVRWGAINTSWGGAGAETRGEAVAVDLPGGQTLFALLRGDAQSNWAGYAMFSVMPLPDAGPGQKSEDMLGIGIDQIIANKAVMALPRTIPAPSGDTQVSAYPMLVRFGDLRDPKTVAEVDPDDLAKSLGAGFKLRRITVQITDDPVTAGIEKRFSWWREFRNTHFDGTSTVSEDMKTKILSAHMASGDFSTEYNK